MIVAETQRLVIRRFVPADIDSLAPILADPEVMRFSVKGPLDVDETREMIGRARAAYREHGFGRWALLDKVSAKFIGFCGVYFLTVDGVEEPEIGYRLARSSWGRGLATEAAIACRDVAVERYGLERLIAVIEPENTASIRVAEKAGFRVERTTTYKGLAVDIYAWESPSVASPVDPGAAL